MTFLYFAHIPFVLLFLAFTIAFVLFNWRTRAGNDRTAANRGAAPSARSAERLRKRP